MQSARSKGWGWGMRVLGFERTQIKLVQCHNVHTEVLIETMHIYSVRLVLPKSWFLLNVIYWDVIVKGINRFKKGSEKEGGAYPLICDSKQMEQSPPPPPKKKMSWPTFLCGK